MSRNIRIILSVTVYIFGFSMALYTGVWLMLVKPVRNTIISYTMGTLTMPQLMTNVLKCICSLTVTGFIWSLGYIASNRIYDSRDEGQKV